MLAIHLRENSFSDRWIQYCEKHGIDYITIDIFDTNIITQLQKNHVDCLLVHINQTDYRTALISRSILLSIENMGIKVFPNQKTFWHYDDKLSQKYLFESRQIPHAPMHVFYNRDDAYDWLSTASFPLVFKLRGGAGSSNVILIRNYKEANRYVRKMFGKGIKPVRSITHDYKTKLKIHKEKKDFFKAIKRSPQTFHQFNVMKAGIPVQKGYILFQEFMPGNKYDIRVTIIGKRAFIFKRLVRENDFRASGSGNIDYVIHEIEKEAIVLAFDSAEKIGAQSIAFDIVYDKTGCLKIIEMSYVYISEPVYNCGGYWDSTLKFHNGPVWPEDAIIEDLLRKI